MNNQIHERSLLMELLRQPSQFNFFQALRLLELHHLKHGRSLSEHDLSPEKYLHFQSNVGLQLKGPAIEKVTVKKSDNYDFLTFELTTNFISFLGSHGVLPLPFTEMTLQKIKQKDKSFVDFLNIFLNRSLLLFYQAWKKQHVFLHYEQSYLLGKPNPQQELIKSFIGLATPAQTCQTVFSAMLFNAGHFAKRCRSADALQHILAAFFRVPVRILTFQGEWLSLRDEDCTQLTNSLVPSNNRLGIDSNLGKRIYACQHRIRIQIGPLPYSDWQYFLPKYKDTLHRLFQLTRNFIELSLSFDVQLILKKQDIKCLQLSQNSVFQLGWDTWLYKEKFIDDSFDLILSEAH